MKVLEEKNLFFKINQIKNFIFLNILHNIIIVNFT